MTPQAVGPTRRTVWPTWEALAAIRIGKSKKICRGIQWHKRGSTGGNRPTAQHSAQADAQSTAQVRMRQYATLIQVSKYFDSLKLTPSIISYFSPVVDLECHMLRFSVRTRGVVHLRQIAERGAELSVVHGQCDHLSACLCVQLGPVIARQWRAAGACSGCQVKVRRDVSCHSRPRTAWQHQGHRITCRGFYSPRCVAWTGYESPAVVAWALAASPCWVADRS